MILQEPQEPIVLAMLDTRPACAETWPFMDPVQGVKTVLLPIQ